MGCVLSSATSSYFSSSSLNILTVKWGQQHLPHRVDAYKAISTVPGTEDAKYNNNVITIKCKQRPSQRDATRICQPFQSRTSVWNLRFPRTRFRVKTPEFVWFLYKLDDLRQVA